MGRLSKKLVSLVTAVVVASSFTAMIPKNVNAVETVQETAVDGAGASSEYGLPEKIDDGVMLHAWNWSFNNIKDSMKEIAESGFNTIQTSPAQACRLGKDWTNADKTNTNGAPSWYYLYQPTYFTVGNAYLGSEAEFKAMCDEAEKYGIKIVVDVVANHLADCGTANASKVDQTLYSEARRMDNGTGTRIGKWNDREQVTQGCCIGMPDINTKAEKSQKVIGEYLQKLAEDGADGYRFDAAKSIELPKTYETGNTSSDFWTNVMGMAKEKNTNAFFYGETLQGDEPGTNFQGYTNIMRVTGSTYGWWIRSAVGYEMWQEEKNGVDVLGGNGTNGKVATHTDDVGKSKYAAGNGETPGSITNDKLVTFVETHDTYANAGPTRCMTQIQREMAWTMIAARTDMIGLFFNRPVDTSFGDNPMSPQGEAYNKMGEKGSDDFKSKNVVAINKFHNAMVGESETISSECNNKVVKVSRGNKGLVLVNVGDQQSINLDTTLPDGEYTNQADFAGTFTVSGGKITGKMTGSSIAILSKVEDVEEVAPTVKVSEKTGTEFEDTLDLTLNVTDAESATYSIDGAKAVTFKDGDKITIGEDAKAGDEVTVKIVAKNGTKETTETYTYTKKAAEDVDTKPVVAVKDGKTTIDEDDVYEFEDKLELTLNATDAESATYLVDDTKAVAFKNGDKITIGEDAEAGDEVTVKIVAKNGTEKTEKTYTFKKKVAEEEELELTIKGIKADKTEAAINEAVNITADVEGATGDVSYKFVEKSDADKEGFVYSDFSKNNTLEWSATEEGTYTIDVIVKDDNGTATKSVKITVLKEAEEQSSLTVSLVNKNQTIELGDKIKLEANAKNTSGEVRYLFQYAENDATKKDSELDWHRVKNYASENFIEWTPSKVGTYKVCVLARDGKNVDKAINSSTILVTVTEKSNNNNDKPNGTGTPTTTPTADTTTVLPIVGMISVAAVSLLKTLKKKESK